MSCPAGKHQPSTTAHECLMCTPGKYQNKLNSLSCESCPNGQYQPDQGQTACKNCPMGYIGSGSGKSSQSQCSICPSGRYSSKSTQASCTACPLGRHGLGPGKNSVQQCAACPTGRYGSQSAIASASDCTACPAGRYGSGSGKISSDQCAVCPKGHYKNDPNQKKCSKCPVGRYQDVTTQSDCKPCPPCNIDHWGGAGPHQAIRKGCGSDVPGTCINLQIVNPSCDVKQCSRWYEGNSYTVTVRSAAPLCTSSGDCGGTLHVGLLRRSGPKSYDHVANLTSISAVHHGTLYCSSMHTSISLDIFRGHTLTHPTCLDPDFIQKKVLIAQSGLCA